MSLLKQGLDDSTTRARAIAGRVANASGFDQALAGAANGQAPAVDLESEMVSLADEQLRYQASATLLQRVYAQLRSSVKER